MNEKNGKTEALSTVLASEQKGLTVYDYIVKAISYRQLRTKKIKVDND
jgi:uncharacterized protein YutD